MKHAEGAGRPSTSTSEEKTVQVQQMILANRRITIDKIAQSLQITFGSAQEIIHEILGYSKVSARWVPQKLTEEHKRRRMEICQTLLNRNNNEGKKFLSRIVTGDESWVHHNSPENKRQSLEWKHPLSLVKKKFKSQLSVGKVMLTIFLGLRSAYFGGFFGKRSTINSARYCDLLAKRLKPAIRTKRRGLLTKKILLQHDNGRHMLPKQPLKPLTNRVLRCWSILHTAQILLLPTIISLLHSKMHYGVVNFLLIKQCKKRCINGCVTSQRLSSQMAFISL